MLGVRGETAMRVPSLALPDLTARPSLEEVRQNEAVRLFVDRARAVVPGFDATHENVAALVQVCRRLDGIPLAIELAAARVRVLTAEQIASRLANRFQLLTGGSRTAVRRQQTLRALVDWSHDLLPERERMLFRRLAVFAGGWTLEAAEEVCSGDGMDPGEVLDLLTGLVDKSLVVAEGQTGEERYRLLETLRQYAEDKLLGAGEAERTRDRHCDWFLQLAERAEPELTGPRQRDWLDRLAADEDNLRSALTWSLERGTGELGLRLVGALYWLWLVRGQAVEARGWLERALALPHAGAATPARAKATLSSWIFAGAMGDAVAARRAAEEAVAFYRQLGDLRGVAWSLRELAHEALNRQEPDRAEPLLDEAYALATRVGDSWIVAQVRESQAFLAEDRGELALGRRLFEQSLALFRALGDWRAIGTSLLCLATPAGEVGNDTTARGYAEEAVAIFRDLRATTRLSIALIVLGRIELGAAHHASSRRCLDESMALARQAGDQELIAGALMGLGSVDRAEGDAAGARARFEEALAVAVHSGRPGLVAELIRWRGVQAIETGMPERGARLLGAADVTGLPPSLYGLVRGSRRTGPSLSRAQDLLGEEAFHEAWAEGQAMTLEEAISSALEEDDA